MILRSLTKHIKAQNWFAVLLDFFIVVLGILLAFQVTNWNDSHQKMKRQAHYLERLDKEFDIIRERLVDGKATFQMSVNSIDFLLKAHRDFENSPESNLPDDEALASATLNVSSGRVPSGSPAAFKEMVASGGLETLKNDELRQALFAYDEFATIARDGWRTIRDEHHSATNHLMELLDLAAPPPLSENNEGLQESIQIIGFERDKFFETAAMQGYLGVLLSAQVNQHQLVQIQLTLAENIESLLDKERNK
ncbi:hypothetical protein [Paraglaciecola hydrolytica]|uniref:Uncharacterized protein n=1 Tax=Paraglaciecola hydrolytica TaxID=1799789 RepID=A0A148KKX0_9ALTE|nr:hypothetical protein [Paraglaciecola hydrolytica]KXI26919.1 hypothetical protein AX660_02675 [Paraglaciecola hydrolytica]